MKLYLFGEYGFGFGVISDSLEHAKESVEKHGYTPFEFDPQVLDIVLGNSFTGDECTVGFFCVKEPVT